MLTIRITATITQLHCAARAHAEWTGPQRCTHRDREERDHESIWQNGCISHSWVERLYDSPASAQGVCGIFCSSTGSPKSQQPLHLYPHSWGLLNGLHLASGIWSSTGQCWVACVWPPPQVLRESHPRLLESGTWMVMKGLHYLSHRQGGYLCHCCLSCFLEGLFVMAGGFVCVFFFLLFHSSTIDPPRGKFISVTSIDKSKWRVSATVL